MGGITVTIREWMEPANEGQRWPFESGLSRDGTPMEHGNIDLVEQIQRCRRLAKWLTDEQMRSALQALAQDYEAQLKQGAGEGFMLQGPRR